jgi:hypothetical protein
MTSSPPIKTEKESAITVNERWMISLGIVSIVKELEEDEENNCKKINWILYKNAPFKGLKFVSNDMSGSY